MADRDVEKNCKKSYIVSLLRRLADDLENNKSSKVQVLNKRFTIPKDVELSLEHEIEDGESELEIKFEWKNKK